MIQLREGAPQAVTSLKATVLLHILYLFTGSDFPQVISNYCSSLVVTYKHRKIKQNESKKMGRETLCVPLYYLRKHLKFTWLFPL